MNRADSSLPLDTHLTKLKWIAVVLMTVCHILLTRVATVGVGLFVGAPVFPIFAGMIVIHLAANPERRFPRYLSSIAIAAAAAELPYLLLYRDALAWPWQVPLNALATFLAGVVLCAFYHRRRYGLLGLAMVPVIVLGRIGLDGSYTAPLAMLLGFIGLRQRWWGASPVFAIVAVGLALINLQDAASTMARWHLAGLGLLPLVYALGKLPWTPPRMPRLFFYAYYPGHLLLIWLVLGAFCFAGVAPAAGPHAHWLDELSRTAIRDYPDAPPAAALQQEALSQSTELLTRASGEAKSRVAAQQFLGFYLINMRSRTDYCRRRGVEITAWTQAFERLHAEDYAKSRRILARGPETADAAEQELVEQQSASFAELVEIAMSDMADQFHVDSATLCQAFAQNGEQIADSMQLSKTNPALSEALAEAR